MDGDWKNIVYIELLRRKKPLYYDVYYFRNLYEIDFVVCSGNKIIELIQVSADISAPKTYNRETSALIRGSKDLNCENLTIITLNTSRTITEKEKPIEVVTIIDWLCNEEPGLGR